MYRCLLLLKLRFWLHCFSSLPGGIRSGKCLAFLSWTLRGLVGSVHHSLFCYTGWQRGLNPRLGLDQDLKLETWLVWPETWKKLDPVKVQKQKMQVSCSTAVLNYVHIFVSNCAKIYDCPEFVVTHSCESQGWINARWASAKKTSLFANWFVVPWFIATLFVTEICTTGALYRLTWCRPPGGWKWRVPPSK